MRSNSIHTSILVNVRLKFHKKLAWTAGICRDKFIFNCTWVCTSICKSTSACVFFCTRGRWVYVYACMSLFVCINKYNDIYKYIYLHAHTHTNNGLKQHRSSKKVYKISCSLFHSFSLSCSVQQLRIDFHFFSLPLIYFLFPSLLQSLYSFLSLSFTDEDSRKINEFTPKHDSFSDKSNMNKSVREIIELSSCSSGSKQ